MQKRDIVEAEVKQRPVFNAQFKQNYGLHKLKSNKFNKEKSGKNSKRGTVITFFGTFLVLENPFKLKFYPTVNAIHISLKQFHDTYDYSNIIF